MRKKKCNTFLFDNWIEFIAQNCERYFKQNLLYQHNKTISIFLCIIRINWVFVVNSNKFWLNTLFFFLSKKLSFRAIWILLCQNKKIGVQHVKILKINVIFFMKFGFQQNYRFIVCEHGLNHLCNNSSNFLFSFIIYISWNIQLVANDGCVHKNKYNKWKRIMNNKKKLRTVFNFRKTSSKIVVIATEI